MSYTEVYFGDSAQIKAASEGSTIHVSMAQPAGDQLTMALQDDNCGPVAALELWSALGEVLLNEGLRGDMEQRYDYLLRKKFGRVPA